MSEATLPGWAGLQDAGEDQHQAIVRGVAVADVDTPQLGHGGTAQPDVITNLTVIIRLSKYFVAPKILLESSSIKSLAVSELFLLSHHLCF